MSPVRESLLAWVWENSKARSIASRSDARRATTSTFASIASEGGVPSSVVTWKTPMELPLMLIGTHNAEQPRPRRFGQASSAVLEGNTMVRALDAAGQSSGDITPHPASSACAVLTSTCRKWAVLESARSSSDRMPGAAWRGLRHEVEDGRLGLRHLECGLQGRLELDPMRQIGLHGLVPGLLTLDPQCVPAEDRDHGDRAGEPDGDGPQEVDPGTVGCYLRLVGRRVQTVVDGRLQGAEVRVEVCRG